MELGNIVEYIDLQKIVCAVVLEIKNHRVGLLTESNREVNLSVQRLSHKGKMQLDLSMGRNKIVDSLKKISNRRESLINNINIKEVWEVLKSRDEWIDLPAMTHLCFPDNSTCDHESAVIRAFFNNRTYFKFDCDRFFPNPEETVEQLDVKEKETVRINRLIEEAGLWVRNAINKPFSKGSLNGDKREFAEILKSSYLLGKESVHYQTAKAILKKAGIEPNDELFRLFVALGIFDEDENIDLHKLGVPVSFPNNLSSRVDEIKTLPDKVFLQDKRKDLTDLSVITIDGQSTLDFDDAISIEDKGGYYSLGIHIADVAHFVKKGDAIDSEAIVRASSIYMPDHKIPMLPAIIAEDVCSLKEGQIRPCISIIVNIRPTADIIDYDIFPSLIRVKRQMTYYDANTVVDDNKEIAVLYDLAKKFRRARLDSGAVYITMPDINVWVDENRVITINKINRESPGRMMISEVMIMANWLMAKFLAENNTPAVFRAQPDAKQRLYKGEEGSLFQNYMQRRLLSRFILGSVPERHSGLGLSCYVTATSPIRKYYDLITQRQIRAICGLDTPHTSEEINKIIQLVEQPMANVFSLQSRRNRYWLLKYLESRTGQKEEAIVLGKRRRSYQILIPEYMIECELPSSSGINLKPEDLIQVIIMHVNARRDVLSVYMG
ncbi:MAG: RNB domain-containing ribonuclease [Proteobacteria bacterium]|nr:RNB domain-containing ribonuclease [Pseudomonadota bacterium]MBU4010570.1 RNB domain-containing ribonuclease [Pseudomonadota bacterium]